MGNPGETSQRVGFGEFELDLRTREVWTNGGKFDLQEQPFVVLSVLLEKPGELVTREELTKRLWPENTFVDFEHSLNRVIKRLRESLNDSADEPRFIETLPRRGYRFISPIRQVSRSDQFPDAINTDSTGATATAKFSPLLPNMAANEIRRRGVSNSTPRQWPRRAAFIAVAAAIGCLAGWVTYRLLSSPPTLRVVGAKQLTTSSRIDGWGGLITDGSRLYFLERRGDRWNLAQTSVAGGDPQLVAAPFQNTRVLDVSPDRSALLVGAFLAREALMPVWTWPVQGGAPKRLGEVNAYDAKWCPDGHKILYGEDDAIYQIDVDGTNAHKFVDVSGRPGFFSWSPDGRLLRFSVFKAQPPSSTIWQVDSDGRDLRRLPPQDERYPTECCGLWSPDGEYFFFQSWRANATDIWVRREKVGWLQRRRTEPTRLTNGPIPFALPVPSTDGHRLFALGQTTKNELIRYDLPSHQFYPFLPSLSIFSLAFSPDGRWVAYRGSQEFALARIQLDGGQPLALAGPELQWGTAPAWSPDARQVAFTGQEPGKLTAIFLVPAEGGSPKRLFPEPENQDEPAWSPDGKFLAFSRSQGPANPRKEWNSIWLFDFATAKLSLLPGSLGLRMPSWSPDGRLIAAYTVDLHKLMVFDRSTQNWAELASASLLSGPPSWSKDEKYLYYQDSLAPNQPMYRVRISDRRKELLTTFETFLQGGIHRVGFQGLAPDGSPIIRLDRGDNDVYALDLELR